MDFRERWSGPAPDGGNGAFEAALVLGAFGTVAALGWFAGHRGRHRTNARAE